MRDIQYLTVPGTYTTNINVCDLDVPEIPKNEWIQLNIRREGNAILKEVKSENPENQCFFVICRDEGELLIPTLRDISRLAVQSACSTDNLNPYFTELMPEFTKETWLDVKRHYLRVGRYQSNWYRPYALSSYEEYAPWICNSELGEIFSLDRMHLYVKSRPYTGEPKLEWLTTSPNFYPCFT
jgi:hypothetical protein